LGTSICNVFGGGGFLSILICPRCSFVVVVVVFLFLLGFLLPGGLPPLTRVASSIRVK
jgi:hypothetical protein